MYDKFKIITNMVVFSSNVKSGKYMFIGYYLFWQKHIKNCEFSLNKLYIVCHVTTE